MSTKPIIKAFKTPGPSKEESPEARPTPDKLSAFWKDKGGRWRTLSLFKEHEHPDYTAIYTLKEHDITVGGRKYISLRRKYLELKDPTGYRIATECLGGWEHWKVLNSSKWFGEHSEAWSEELRVLLESEYFGTMTLTAENYARHPSAAASATKWLDENYGSKGRYKAKRTKRPAAPNGRGRPSKEEVAGALKAELRELEDHEADARRVGLTPGD